MELTFTNKAMQAMTGFAIQFNKNRYGIIGALSMALILCLLVLSADSLCKMFEPRLGPTFSLMVFLK